MPDTVSKSPIAIVGMGCVLPDAPDVDTFWANLQAGKDSIREVPHERWDPSLYYSPDKTPDKTYTKIGAFVTDDAFNGLEYRMPPKVVEQVDNAQRWALAATRQAFLDAGYATGIKQDADVAGSNGQGPRDFDRDRCAVILGNAMGGESNKVATKRAFWPEARKAIEDDPDFQALPADKQAAILTRSEGRYKATTVPVTEDTMPGHLSNVFAGRIANTFDLGGKNFTTDAACASSLAALDSAMETLRKDEADMVIWGGADRSMDITPYIQFSAIGALSPDGSRPFDKDANGFVMGEGCAMFILRRLEDAERDGDTIHAVVRGIGGSSDGKGKGITAPNPAGQVKAVRRAYKDAEMDPFTIGYLEAHGTSTPVGDPVELTSVIEAFGQVSDAKVPTGAIKVGSVKSNIGHLKAGAGAAGMLKAVLALKHGHIPPSINVRELNPRIDWATSPFSVATDGGPWQRPEAIPRRAAVSSFGFGGTNFHVVLEEYVPGALVHAPAGAAATTPPAVAATTPTRLPPASLPMPTFDLPAFQAQMADRAGLELQSLVLDADALPGSIAGLPGTAAFTDSGEGARLRDLFYDLTAAGVAAERRVGIAPADLAEIPKKLALAEKAAANPAAAKLAFQQGVFINQGKPDGKVAFLFPGQGTQYVNMGRDLARKYAVVRHTFEEADAALQDELDGVKLTDILWPTPDTAENQKASNEKLKLTEFTQPAVLAMDVAILRLLKQWGIKPDMVAGHSLGEYGALVAAGVLTFTDALHAVAARGREMANVDLPDLGKMASIPADWETVSAALEKVDDYVICANKNCPSQTVIAGSSAGVDAAVALLTEQGLQCIPLPVSAAFHSEIVAPASGPLRNVLARLDVQAPKIRVLSNVGAEPYPDDPEAIRDNLATQVASAVEWIGIMERMHQEGVRTFIEVGPKKALTGFAMDIFKDRMAAPGPDMPVAICANHPKKGEIQHINELFAFLGAWGFRPQMPDLNDTAVYTAEFRDPRSAFETKGHAPAPATSDALAAIMARLDALEAKAGAAASGLIPVTAPTHPTTPVAAASAEVQATAMSTTPTAIPKIGIAGISVGLPGRDKPFFADDNWDRILRGDNLIDVLDDGDRQAMVDKAITRLVKSAGGQGTFETIDETEQVIKLAGRRGRFDLAEWGVSEELTEVLDVTSQYAIAAALEALHDAGIPLQRTYKTTSTGSQLPQGWALPRELGDETGVIFASAFPGYDALLDNVKAAGTEAMFNRKFLFHVLSMGHAQVAQFLGARGPNTQVNAACASTTQAIAIAEDWIKAGRCKRVLVLGADDATSPNLMEWIGSGFLASGAATTKEDVTEAALPFDARRHGMIIGMGAVGLVVEAEAETETRGMRPVARLLATEVCNSAFHGSRLDIDHIASTMRKLVGKTGLSAGDIAAETVFMSHETYTPARGGSASAEIHALRAAFGTHADKVVIANTKGFTGHPQGAGIEDAVVLKALQRGTVPPIPNLKEPDPELGTLNLSKGGTYDVRYALRLAAGFGSQVAMTFTELVAKEDARIADQSRYDGWLATVTGIQGAALEVVDRTLRIIDGGPAATTPATSAAEPTVAPEPIAAREAAPVAAAGDADVLAKVTAVIADKTGYPTDMLDPDMDMEADLGIDTVKQAELFGELREMFGVPFDESLSLADYNTLRKVAGYMSGEGSRSEPSPRTNEPSPRTNEPSPAASEPPNELVPASNGTTGSSSAEPTRSSTSTNDDALATVTALVAQKTGYPADMLEPDLDMEADLGIDTVKQAELFGELREHFGVPFDESLSLADYNTLRKVAGYMSGEGSRSEPSPRTSEPQGELVQNAADMPDDARKTQDSTEPGAASTAQSDVLAEVIALVADQTGYPADMLEPDLDMEADLGIDTVKQAEIFGILRERYGVPLREDLSLADYNTLAKVAAYMGDNAGGDGARPSAPTVVTEPIDATAGIVRRIPCIRPEPLPGSSNDLPGGKVLVIGDPDMAVTEAIKEAGWSPVHDGDDIVGLACIVTRQQDDAHDVAGRLFDAAKAHRESLAEGFVLVVTAQDGAHGLERPRDPAMAAVAGLGKALRKELPSATVKVVDVSPDAKDAGDLAVRELRKGGKRTEVCYDRDGRRFVIDVASEPLPAADLDVAGKAFVVSGGAQGITVEMLAAMAPQGPKFLLLGRTDVPTEAAEWATWDDAAWKAHEQRVMVEMKERGDKVTPVALQKALSPLRKAAEVQRNLDRLTGLGAEVLYAPVDVQDADAVRDAVVWARDSFGAIDGVIHAAGVEISKDLASKDRDQFDLVFGIKHDGMQALLAATAADDLQWLVSFGSVAGRFGNIGQTDYSAVNEYLCKAVKVAAAKRRIPTAFTIAWGPWGEVGMATKGSIMQIMEASGVTPIPTADGVAQFLAEMANPGSRESVVAGALGAIDIDRQVTETRWDPDLDAVREQVAADAMRFRLLADVEAATEDEVTVVIAMDKAVHPYARDHAIDGVPYFPGVFGLEAFAEAAALLMPDAVCTGVLDASFGLPLKQLKDAPVRGRIHARRAGKGQVRCTLTTRMVGPDGVERGEPREHFAATVRMEAKRAAVRTADVPTCTREKAIEAIYPPFFHGPSFQVLRYAGPLADESVGMGFLPAEAAFTDEFEPSTMPMVAEMLFQLCGLRTMDAEQRMSLPAAIEQMDILDAPSNGELRLWARFNGQDDDGLRRFDAAACTTDGKVIMRMLGYGMVETGPVPEGRDVVTAVDAATDEGAEASSNGQRTLLDVPAADLAPLPVADVDLPDIDGVSFAAVAVDGDDMQWFTEDEMTKYEAFDVPKRAAEWRAGRLAAKAVVTAQDPGLSATQATVVNEEGGRPVAHVDGEPIEAVLSITHRDGIAVAALATGPIGIDVETVEERSDAWREESFNDAERALASDDASAACIWAAKEAVFKRIGTGLRTPLHAWTVKPDGQGGARVEGPDSAFGVAFFDVDGRVLAVTCPAIEAATVDA